MIDRKKTYDTLRVKMEEVGFIFEREQKPHHQNRKETELVFVHPQLIRKWEDEGYKTAAKKFYIKPLSDESECEIGFVTGKSSPLHDEQYFSPTNSHDSFNNTPAWTNKERDRALDRLLKSIEIYLEYAETIERYTNTFLFAWNPNKWDWVDLQKKINQIETVGYTEERWSCGNSKSIKKGDRVFLIRLGQEPRGIMGSGYAKSSIYVASHWDGTEGNTSNYIDIDFDILINPEENVLFDKEALEVIDPNNIQNWFPHQSGISIKQEIVGALESKWFNFIIEHKYIKNSFVSVDILNGANETFCEGKSKDVMQTRYERNPEARKRCLLHYGYSCKVCSFNFEDHFGEVGKGYIHVHHINQISEIRKEYNINPIKDLIPVCPNCHVMIHSKRPAFTIEEIKAIIATNNTDKN